MNEVNAAIITIGDELLIGQTIDTNSAFIAQQLNKIGIWVKRRIAIGDVKEEILQTLKEQTDDCDVVIVTGGLGPTADDITKPVLCEFFKTKLVVNEEALQNVKDIFTKLNRPLTERNLKQAEVPEGCIVLPNRRGTAPGMYLTPNPSPSEMEKGATALQHNLSSTTGAATFFLPGVPNEMKGLMIDSVIPLLNKKFLLPFVVHRTMLLAGVGESAVADALVDFENALPEFIKLAYLPAYGTLRLRLTGRGENEKLITTEIDLQFQKLKLAVAEWMVADEDVSLGQAVLLLLRQKNKTIATAESCTGGYIAQLITANAGASANYNGSVVSYSNKAKEELVHVQQPTLKNFGAVSEETVLEMARGVLLAMHTDYAIATSGIMGPDGGSEEKPVGTVWIAVASAKRSKAMKVFFRFDRSRNIEMTAQTALTMLYRFVVKEEGNTV
ncbi:MAG: nicotinamide-nucleotide amidohydrolase family protein, partial [Bacteroidota bacterium]